MFSCAQQTSLSGGDKDTLAPILMVDSNMSLVNMKQTSINLEFNENIQFLKSKRALITNPSINEVEVTAEKNKIEINWEDTLNHNTTYSFLFINSIADITEKNKINEFNYVVSTGPKIDSGSIKIDGIDIRDLAKADLRERIAVVLQDVFLFSGDIKGNISLNNEDIDFENMTGIQDVFQSLFKNPAKLMNIVKNVGDKLDSRIKSGDINQNELIECESQKNLKIVDLTGAGDLSTGCTLVETENRLRMDVAAAAINFESFATAFESFFPSLGTSVLKFGLIILTKISDSPSSN